MSPLAGFRESLQPSAQVVHHHNSKCHLHTCSGHGCPELHLENQHRYHSFAPTRPGNKVKWYTDGCSYFWAVSVALDEAQHSIWIMDWCLSPEVYLRRPPSRNHQYRFDRMLQAAASRGVKVQIMVQNVGVEPHLLGRGD
jgi:phospholipase D1/2